MHALIDGDLVVHRCAAAYEQEDLGLAIWQAEALATRLCEEVGATERTLFLTGSDNFRYQYNPQYKANRDDKPRPRHLQPLREHFIVNLGAKLSQGCEADDLMGIAQTEAHTKNEASIIVSLDKDMLMIPGNHYSWEISGPLKDGNRWTKEAVRRYTHPVEGLRYFYGQLLLGDKSDNIFGFDGLARAKVPLKMQWMFDRLDSLDDEESMKEFVIEQYQDFEGIPAVRRFMMNATCLWIQRYEGEIWGLENIMGEHGQPADSTDSLSPL